MSWRSALKGLGLLWAVGLLAACATTPADLVLRNGKVVTVDDALPEAEAIAVTGDRVVAVGSDREIRKYVGESTEVIDLEGKLAIPGFIEGHGHFAYLGRAMLALDLTGAANWDEIVRWWPMPFERRSRVSGFSVGDGIRRSGTRRRSPPSRGCRSTRAFLGSPP